MYKAGLVSDEPVLARGLRGLLATSGEFDLVELGGDLDEAAKHLGQAACDLLIVDVGDEVQIQQIILNLIVNAFAAMRDTRLRDRRLIVRTRAGTEGVAISVHDRGTGIAPEHFPKLFDRFFTTRSDGLGMGLSIARSITAAHGGRIWATNNSDSGATFHIVLPVAPTTRDQ